MVPNSTLIVWIKLVTMLLSFPFFLSSWKKKEEGKRDRTVKNVKLSVYLKHLIYYIIYMVENELEKS